MKLERGTPPRKAVVRVVVALIIASQGAALFGALTWAELVDSRPALLIALNPRNTYLALVTNQLDAATYYTIGFLRLVASDPLYFLIGYWYGERALAWTERRSRTYGPLVRDGERMFKKAAYPFIFAAPNNVICILSAATGVRLRTFIILNLSGTVARLIAVRRLGEAFSSPLSWITDLIGQYRVPLLILSAVAVAWTIFGEFRGNDSELRTLTSLGDEDATPTEAESPDGTDGAPTTATDVGLGEPVDDRD